MSGNRYTGGPPVLSRPITERWSEDLAPYDALAAEVGAAQQAGWFVTGVYCFDSGRLDSHGSASETINLRLKFPVDGIVVGFAKPADDLDHAAAAYLFEELYRPGDFSVEPDPADVNRAVGTMVIVGVAPHHADRGWPAYVPVPLADTCIADPHHPRLSTREEGMPQTNPPPPPEVSNSPLDQAGKPFARWDDSNRFTESRLKKPVSSTPATPST